MRFVYDKWDIVAGELWLSKDKKKRYLVITNPSFSKVGFIDYKTGMIVYGLDTLEAAAEFASEENMIKASIL